MALMITINRIFLTKFHNFVLTGGNLQSLLYIWLNEPPAIIIYNIWFNKRRNYLV